MTYKNTFEKFLWLGKQAKEYKDKLKLEATLTIFIDEMETIEHTKCKPVSILMIVNAKMEILEAKAAIMPAKGRLANFSVKKYGKRIDDRNFVLRETLEDIKNKLPSPPIFILSDAKPSYATCIREYFPEARHDVHCRAQKEKDRHRDRLHEFEGKRRYDPMFKLNQRCAKLRSDIKRLVRRSWCTTKKIENLQLHLDLYIQQQHLQKQAA